jgi:hypothetical protein
VKDSYYEELHHVFNTFPKYHINILLGNFIAKGGREDIFKLTIGNESLHEISNDFNQIHHIPKNSRQHSGVLDVQSFRAAEYNNDHHLVVAKFWDKLSTTKHRSHRFHMERFNLKKIN